MKIYATLITILCIFLGKEEANALNKKYPLGNIMGER